MAMSIRREFDTNITQSEKKYKFLFDNNTLPIITWDFETLNILEVNESAIVTYGYSQEEFLRMNIRQLRPEEDIPLLEEATKNEKSYGKIHKRIWRHIKKNGELMFMEVSGYLITIDGKKVVINHNYDLTEKIKVENKLKESEEKYKLLFDKSPLPMLLYDLATYKILEVNETAVLHYGYSREEFLSMTIHDYRPKGEIEKVSNILQNILGKEKVFHLGVYNHIKKNQTIIKVEVSGYRLSYQDKDCMMVVCNDVTERDKAQIVLEERNRFIETALDNLPIGIAVNKIDDGSATFINKQFAEIYGWPAETFTDVAAFFKKVYPDEQYREEISNRILADIESGDPARMNWQEIAITTENGSERIINAKNIPVNDQNLMISTVEDVTERIKAQNELKISNERFGYVTNATSDAIYDWDLIKGTLFWGERFSSIFGYDLHGILPDKSSWENNIHPGDADRVINGIYELIDSSTNKWESEYRFRKEDGSYAFVIDRGFVIRDANGKAIRMVGSIRDITKRKKEEQQRKLLESVITNTKDAVIITEAEPFDEPGPRILYVNDAFTKMTGYTYEEVIGKTPRILQGPKSDKNELNRLSASIRKWESCEITTINYKKNGEEFWINFSVTPAADAKGCFTHWIAIERDVTEQKIAEQTLRASYNERNSILESIGDGFFAIDNNWIVTYWNKSAETIMKKTRKEIVGKDLREVYPKSPGRTTYFYYEKAFREKEVQNFEMFNTEVNLWFEVIVYPSATGLSVYFRDITERLNYTNTIETQNKKLREIAWAQSHVARVPVANILGLIGILKDISSTEEDKNEILNHLFNEAKKLDCVITDIVEKTNEIKL